MNAKWIRRRAAAAGMIIVASLLAPVTFAGEATLFANRDFQGPAMTVRGPSPNLERIGFNDTASSLVVRAGVWEVCSKVYFEGYCAQLQPGEYSSFGTSVNDRIASLREVTQTIGNAPGARTSPRIVLYEHAGFGGHSIVIDRPVISRLTNQWFANGAGSMRIEGGTWFFCSNSDFAGHCQTFGPGDYAHLPWTQERVASGYFVPAS